MTEGITNKTNEGQEGQHSKPPHEMNFVEKVAEAAGADESYVRKILKGARTPETKLGERIGVAALMLKDGENKLLEEVKRVVKV